MEGYKIGNEARLDLRRIFEFGAERFGVRKRPAPATIKIKLNNNRIRHPAALRGLKNCLRHRPKPDA